MQTVARVVRKLLSDDSYVYDVELFEYDVGGATLVLHPADEHATQQLQIHLVTMGGCIDGGCNY